MLVGLLIALIITELKVEEFGWFASFDVRVRTTTAK